MVLNPCVGMLGDDSWPPAVEFYDFLNIMDQQEPESTRQQAPAEEEGADDEEVNVEEHLVAEETLDDSSDVNLNHSEL